MRPWPDQRHLAAQDVEQLRQFIERKAAEKRADTGNTRVVARRLTQMPLVRCVMGHRAEFQCFEGEIAVSCPTLAKQDGAGAVDANQQSDQQHRHRPYGKCQQADDDVDKPLGGTVAVGSRCEQWRGVGRWGDAKIA